jgi:tetratricopeptide (TPR) repeat protein
MKLIKLVAVSAFAALLTTSSLAAQAASAPPSTSFTPVSPAMPADIQRLYNAGRYREAVEALEAAVAANASQAPLHYWLGRSFYELRDFSRSISSFEHAVTLDPNRSDYHEWLGRACGRKAEETSLLATFSSLALARRTNREFALAVLLEPHNLQAQRDYIRYLLNAPAIVGGGEDRAAQQIQELAKVDLVEGELAHAEDLTLHRKFDEASKQYQQILTVKNTRVDVYMEVADYFSQHSDAAEVNQAADEAAQVAPEDPRILYYRGAALIIAQKDTNRAVEDLRSYMAMVPDAADVPSHSEAHEWLGKLYEGQNKMDQAASEYQAALDLDPKNKSLREAVKRTQTR